MADVKLVISLPEDAYNIITGKIDIANIDLYSTLIQAVKNGTPLEKIRSEVELIERYGTNNDHDIWLRTPEEIKKDVLEIIDKYNKESEKNKNG